MKFKPKGEQCLENKWSDPKLTPMVKTIVNDVAAYAKEKRYSSLTIAVWICRVRENWMKPLPNTIKPSPCIRRWLMPTTNRANIEFGRGDLAGAIADYTKAIELGFAVENDF